MTFKNALLLLCTLFVFSCSEFLKGKPKKDDAIEVSKESMSCMKDATEKIKNFMDSSVKDKEIDAAFACVDSTLNEFGSRVNGKADPNSFNQEELQKIFDKFTPGAKLNANSTQELLAVKAALIGGSADKITKQEISDIRKFLVLVKDEAKALSPYAHLFKFRKEEPSISKKMLEEGFGQLNLSLKNLYKASRLSHSDYSFNDLQKLISSLNFEGEKHEELIELALKVKTLLAGTQPLRSGEEYLRMIDNITEVLHLYSFHLQGYVQFALNDAGVLNDTIEYVEKWVALLENSVQFKTTKVISVETLDPVLKDISDRGLLPIQVKTETLLQFYKTLIMRAFDGGVTADIGAFTGLNQGQINRLKREIAVFKMNLESIAILARKNRTEVGELQVRLQQFKPRSVAWLKKLDDDSQNFVVTAFEEMRSESISERPVLYRAKKMVIAANQFVWAQSWEDQARALYGKMLARELMIGWGNFNLTKSLAQAYLTESQLVQWYADFKTFGIEMKTFDPRSANSGAVSFKQADLLTYSANGDDRLSFFEINQYLNMLISGGQDAKEMMQGFERARCSVGEKDAFDNFWMNEKCAVEDLRANFKTYFSNMPFLTEYLASLDERQFKLFYINLMEVTRVNPLMFGQKVETADLRNMSILLHYIESIYAVFDKDMNRKLSAEEIRTAYERFKNFATKFAQDHSKKQLDEFGGAVAKYAGLYYCYSSEDLIRESFVFMLYKGHPPQKSDLTTMPCSSQLLFREAKPLIRFEGEVDRGQVINTFKILKNVLGS